jgi:hypothetical protein
MYYHISGVSHPTLYMINFFSISTFHLQVSAYCLVGYVPFSTPEKGLSLQAARKAWVASCEFICILRVWNGKLNNVARQV